jgi:alpha-ketoglutarate-dependent taurine dioxygenase
MKHKTTKELKDLFDDLEMNAYNRDYHTYYYKDANQIVRKHFERLQKQVSVEPEVIKKILHIIGNRARLYLEAAEQNNIKNNTDLFKNLRYITTK